MAFTGEKRLTWEGVRAGNRIRTPFGNQEPGEVYVCLNAHVSDVCRRRSSASDLRSTEYPCCAKQFCNSAAKQIVNRTMLAVFRFGGCRAVRQMKSGRESSMDFFHRATTHNEDLAA